MTTFKFDQTVTPTDEDLAEFVKFLEASEIEIEYNEDEERYEAYVHIAGGMQPLNQYTYRTCDQINVHFVRKLESNQVLTFLVDVDGDEQVIQVARGGFNHDELEYSSEGDWVALESELDWPDKPLEDESDESDESDELIDDNGEA